MSKTGLTTKKCPHSATNRIRACRVLPIPRQYNPPSHGLITLSVYHNQPLFRKELYFL
nr:MAG TPA: hypothetical protein [Caudoviricetes sp.]